MAISSPIPGLPYLRLTPESATWPRQLSAIPDAPRELWAIGNTSLLNSHCIAVVGTRAPSKHGEQVAHDVARQLAEEGYTIVAGLARGIDTAAHVAAINAGGFTIAVLVDIQLETLYPKENRILAREILAHGGLLIAEHPVGSAQQWPYGDSRFKQALMARDRIQSGLSFCTIPVQAGLRSGTLHTIHSARAQGRLVRAPLMPYEEVALHADLYAGIHASLEWEEYFRPGDMTYAADVPSLIEDEEGAEWRSFIQFLEDYRQVGRPELVVD